MREQLQQKDIDGHVANNKRIEMLEGASDLLRKEVDWQHAEIKDLIRLKSIAFICLACVQYFIRVPKHAS